MRRAFRSLGVIPFSVLAVLLLVGLQIGPAVATATAGSQERQFLQLINKRRATLHLTEFQMHWGLRTMARRHAVDMSTLDDIFHTEGLASGISERVPRWRLAGENVGVGFDVPSLQAAFVASPSHRKNFDEPRFTLIGVGVDFGRDEALFVTQVMVGLRSRTQVAAVTRMASITPTEPAPIREGTHASLVSVLIHTLLTALGQIGRALGAVFT